MTQTSSEKFSKIFKKIVYLRSDIKSCDGRLRSLYAWDKNDSHKKAILRELDNRKRIKEKLDYLLDGRSYEEWRDTSKELTMLRSRLKDAVRRKAKIEENILLFKNKMGYIADNFMEKESMV